MLCPLPLSRRVLKVQESIPSRRILEHAPQRDTQQRPRFEPRFDDRWVAWVDLEEDGRGGFGRKQARRGGEKVTDDVGAVDAAAQRACVLVLTHLRVSHASSCPRQANKLEGRADGMRMAQHLRLERLHVGGGDIRRVAHEEIVPTRGRVARDALPRGGVELPRGGAGG